MQSVMSHPKITVIQPEGHLNASGLEKFQSQLITTLTSDGPSIILVDMEQVESLDSAGLMALVSALSLAQRLEKRFSLCSVRQTIKLIFELTQLDRVFEMFDNSTAFRATLV